MSYPLKVYSFNVIILINLCFGFSASEDIQYDQSLQVNTGALHESTTTINRIFVPPTDFWFPDNKNKAKLEGNSIFLRPEEFGESISVADINEKLINIESATSNNELDAISTGSRKEFWFPKEDTEQIKTDKIASCEWHGKTGLCVKVEDCNNLESHLSNSSSVNICGYKDSIGMICCPIFNDELIVNTIIESETKRKDFWFVDKEGNNTILDSSGNTTTSKPNKSSRKNKKRKNRKRTQHKELPAYLACQNYRSYMESIFSNLDVGPEPNSEYAHMVALGYKSNSEQRKYDFNCSGSLISSRYILTAAHCLVDNPEIVRLGAYNIENNYDFMDIKVQNFTYSNHYQPQSNYDDIGLIYLAKKVSFTATIYPACLNSHRRKFNSGSYLTLTGWSMAHNNTSINVFQKDILRTIKKSDCSQYLSSSLSNYNETFPSGIIKRQICALHPELAQPVFKSGSGEPLQIYDNRFSVIVGVSFFDFGEHNAPRVFTKVAFYLRWIEEIIWPTPTNAKLKEQ